MKRGKRKEIRASEIAKTQTFPGAKRNRKILDSPSRQRYPAAPRNAKPQMIEEARGRSINMHG